MVRQCIRLCQHIDFGIEQNTDTVRQLISTLISRQLLTADEGNAVKVNHITQFFQSEMATRIQRSSKVFRELPFTYAHDGSGGDYQIIQGIADCLFQEDDGWVLLDYKTDSIRVDLSRMLKLKKKCIIAIVFN